MKEEREIRTVLHDGSEVIMNTEERVIFQSSRPGAIPLSVDADTVFDDVLITLDQANQQLTEKDTTIDILRQALRATRQTLGPAQIIINAALGEGEKEWV